jgi:hypothetical protein
MNSPEIERPAPAPPLGDAPATEPSPRKPLTTAAEINKENKAFWDKHEPPPPPPDPLAIIRAEAQRIVLRESAREAVKANDAARRAKGMRNSAKARRDNNIKRNQDIHDLHAAGMAVKQIADDPKIGVDHKKLSASQIRRVLKLPRP